MELNKIHSIYFIGIGGIGMSALARWFNANGYKVAGYDRTQTTLTTELEQEGMNVHYEDNVKLIAPEFFEDDALVIYTPAVPKDHSELNYFINKGSVVKKRSEVLGMITEKMFTVAVSGTHGKTTTSSMIAHILRSAGKDCSAFLGGITQNYNTNLLLNKEKNAEGIVVVEADEYDRSFLKLHPDVAVITSMDPDHLDIYKDAEDFKKTFNMFAAQVEANGSLIFQGELTLDPPKKSQQYISFGTKSSLYRAEKIRVENAEFVFDIVSADEKVENIRMQVPGHHNIQNALAAFIAGRKVGVSADDIKKALHSFKGVKRRFEYHVKTKEIIYIDDYAHHPTELNAFINAVKTLYPSKTLTLIFQPHLYSRTRDFMEGFAESLSQVDQLVLMDIYPARELPIKGITSEALLAQVKSKSKMLASKENLLEKIQDVNTDIIATVGAGDIDIFIEPIKQMLLNKKYV
ncbi:MAG TPA: UDP-N-acetylmuramate--L-alanine ligase [Cytophagaceae bacterium]|jgi:UDP-N-acetylmuramate--alanine ligase|nr:UDP-N-acetylmuramate--L-alanine ligase [Cytophagaceae bacterium]